MSSTPLTFYESQLDLSALDEQLSITSLSGGNNRDDAQEQEQGQQRLPNEILRHLFLYSDPHTLYTSVRALNTHWKGAVETDLLHELFKTQTWRVGLRVSRKKPLPDQLHPAPDQGSGQEEQREESEEEQAARLAIQDAQINSLMSTPGVTEDEINSLLSSFSNSQRNTPLHKTRSTLHIIPLTFQRYDAESTSLSFGTGAEWHALFDGFSAEQENGSRLDLDFGLCWRFPGDGQDVNLDTDAGADQRAKVEAYWGTPDIENGWLSRFYCSNYDLKVPPVQLPEPSDTRVLRSTPLTPRTRRHVQHPSFPILESIAAGEDDEIAETSYGSRQLTWSDEGHEYASLTLALGIEFFVRRSARTNLLSRRLETFLRAHAERSAAPTANISSSTNASSSSSSGMASASRFGGAATPVVYDFTASDIEAGIKEEMGEEDKPLDKQQHEMLRLAVASVMNSPQLSAVNARYRGSSSTGINTGAVTPLQLGTSSTSSASAGASSRFASGLMSPPSGRHGTSNGSSNSNSNTGNSWNWKGKDPMPSLLGTGTRPSTPLPSYAASAAGNSGTSTPAIRLASRNASLKGKSVGSPSPLSLSEPFEGAAAAQKKQQKTTAAGGNKTSGRNTPKNRNNNTGLIIKRRSTPRAEFAARLCRAERMSPQVAAYFAEELDIDAPSSSAAAWSADDRHNLQGSRRRVDVSVARKLANHHAEPRKVAAEDDAAGQDAASDEEESRDDPELSHDVSKSPEYAHAVSTLRKVSAPVLWYWSR